MEFCYGSNGTSKGQFVSRNPALINSMFEIFSNSAFRIAWFIITSNTSTAYIFLICFDAYIDVSPVPQAKSSNVRSWCYPMINHLGSQQLPFHSF
jgi:hypothetical protein